MQQLLSLFSGIVKIQPTVCKQVSLFSGPKILVSVLSLWKTAATGAKLSSNLCLTSHLLNSFFGKCKLFPVILSTKESSNPTG